MHVYIRLLIEGAIILAGFVFILWVVLIKSRNDRKLNLRDSSLSSEELEDHAKKVAITHSVSSKKNLLNWPVPRMNENYEFIRTVYKGLNEDIQNKAAIPASAEWLLDNFYIIEEQVKGLRRDLTKKSYARLPVLKSGLLKGYARIFAVAVELVAHTDGQMDEKVMSDYLKAYQSHSVLFDREIWAVPMVMRLALIENIRHLCENIKNTQSQWHKADEIFDEWLSSESTDSFRVPKSFKDSLKTTDEANPSFVEHLFYRLRRSGRSYAKVLRTMDENLAKLGESTEHVTQKEHSKQSVDTVSMGNCITSLRVFATLDWADLFESASFVEQILKLDPDGTYPRMDLFTRSYYRGKIEELASKFGVSELHVAREAVCLAREAQQSAAAKGGAEEAQSLRTYHVGYYLIGKGLKDLESRQEKKNAFLRHAFFVGKSFPGALYLGSIGLITLLLTVAAFQYASFTAPHNALLFALLAGFAVLIPASEIAVNALNWIVCKALKPAVFPRLELEEGIPESLSTIVVVPTLLPDKKRVNELLRNLESHYLSNREENLYFALIGAFSDSDNADMKNENEIIGAAMSGIVELNRKYSGDGRDKFYFFHRESQFNKENNNWIGWERKRGALMEFNDLVLGSLDTSFSYFSCKAPPFSNVKYIITLDSDTILPMGMARKMIGTMAHPLNTPVIDRVKGIVIEGYGLMQPRVDVDIESSNKSLFSRIFTGQEGIDPYANAISDVYQDLFGEGIFTGKGIYDLDVFQSALKNAIPDNAILSHDLLEGSYVRTGLVTDLKLIDSYPSKYNSFAARLHRWVRGDWQLLPLLYRKIFDRSHSKIVNPLSLLSKWKMFDNLRRSLVPPALLVLAALCFCLLPGSIAVWMGIFLLTLSFPLLTAVVGFVFSRQKSDKTKRHIPVMVGLKAAFLQVLLTLCFLPYQAVLMMNAILVTLGRVWITKKNLLEWVTSADVEKTQKNSLGSFVSAMSASLWAAPVVLALTLAFKPTAFVVSLLLFVLWGSAPFVAYWISKDVQEKASKVSAEDLQALSRIARKTWRYFEEFCDAKNHYLAPDNYQADPPRGVAYRTSPTNIGLGLLSTLTARDFGYIGTCALMNAIEKTIAIVEGLEKWNGHLYNWYDTRTLKPLGPGYISTVDSGNLVGSLIALGQGLKDYLNSPLADARFASGLRDTFSCAGVEGLAIYETIAATHKNEAETFDLMLWNQTLNELSKGVGFEKIKKAAWSIKIARMVQSFKKELSELMPGIDLLERFKQDLCKLDSVETVTGQVDELLALLKKNNILQELPAAYSAAVVCTDRLIDRIARNDVQNAAQALAWLCELKEALNSAIVSAVLLINRSKALIARIDVLSDSMKFSPLYVKKKQLFSIGYNVEDNKLTDSYYDLLASEARQTSYICIARGEIPQAHWFKMGRALTVVDGYKGLVSWTGTMFEYLMPLLLMKSYKNSLLDETYSFVIKSQKKYGRQRNMPWGTSESGYNALDLNLDYQYKAIGVPWLGLKRGLIEDAVAAPYATMLALLVDPEGAVKNMHRLKAEGLDGPYGFYEAADYTPERLLFETKRTIVKSFMAHHQGMSLLALNNYLNKNIMQERFHADPAMYAARLLLQEKVPANLVFTKETKEKVVPFKGVVTKEESAVRRFGVPGSALPNAHILSNGNYSIMLTDSGTGYSKNKMVAVSRWRADRTLDSYGMFFYLRDVDTNAVWSATYAPLNVVPDLYEVVFTADKASFKRRDGQVETKTEVVVASGDNTEIRRMSLKNLGETPCVLEVTSYFEVVLATQAADVAHSAFSNLFVETCFLPEKNCIIANRRPRSETDKSLWMANAVVLQGGTLGDIQYETDRMQLLGRGHTVKTPIVMERGKPLSNTIGPVLDPVMSLRVRVHIKPGKTVQLSFITTVGESNESLLSLIDKYATPDAVEGAFRLALTRSQVETNYLNLDAAEMALYQEAISHILFLSPLRRQHQELILRNTRGQSSLWRYGISGDFPIALVLLKKTDKVEILYEVLKAHEYWRLMDLRVDLVILSEEEYSYTLPLYAMLSDIVNSRQTHDILNKPKDVFILDRNKMPFEDVNLLYAAARILLKGDGRTMAEQVHSLQLPSLPPLKYFAKADAPFAKAESPFALPVPKDLELLFYNGCGGFTPDGREYVIQLEKGQNTPAPWVNVIANPGFGFLVSEAGSGYTWYANSRENKLTPWSNDAVSDEPGEAIYIGDGDTGEIWTATSLPIREEEPYTIRHGFGYSVFEHTSHGIEQKLTQHVPVNASVKVSMVTLKNASKQKRHLTLTYYVRPVLGVSDQDTAMHIKTSVGEAGVFQVENPYNEEFAGKICFIDSSIRERSATSDRSEFFGSGDRSAPQGLSRETLSGAMGAGFDPCAAIQVKVTLDVNESRDIVFLLGMAGTLQEVNNTAHQYRKVKNAKESLAEVINFWADKLNIVQVSTPDTSMNLMLNGWLAYQVLSCRLWARSGFYQSGGAFGFRDQLQDVLSVAHLWPQIARAQILLHARHQFTQGDVQHWWHEPQGKGTRTRFSDDLLWLPYVTAEYIRITGDSKILEEELSYLEDAVLTELEDERYGKPEVSSFTSSLFDHCIRAADYALKFGEHGLPLMGSGDWNDGMNTVGNKGCGESVWLGWFETSVLEKLIPLCMLRGDQMRAQRYTQVRAELVSALEENAWDGNWYRRAYFDNGQPLGSVQNTDCKIDSIAQSWSVLSGAGNPQRALQAMNSLEDYLVSREDGLIKLLTPPFVDGDLEPGYIKGYVPGVRENGGQYTHAAAWVVMAFAQLGNGDKAAELFNLINPINHTGNHRECARYKAEPYVMAADVYAVHPHTGRGGWSWYTGSAGWMYRAGIESILGFEKIADALVLNPCIPGKWKEYTITYKFESSLYEIKVANPQGVNRGVKSIACDGIVTQGNRLDLRNDGKTHVVEVLMGLQDPPYNL